MEPLICQKVIYRAAGQYRKPGCYRCVVAKNKRDYTRYTTYFSKIAVTADTRLCHICGTTNLIKVVTGRNKQKAKSMLQAGNKSGVKINHVEIVEKINRRGMEKNKLNSAKPFKEIQEVVREHSIENNLIVNPEIEMEYEKSTNSKKQEMKEADSSSEATKGLEPIYYSEMSEEEKINMIEEILKEEMAEIPDSEQNNIIPELEDIPPLLNNQAMQELLNVIDRDNMGQDTCERYTPDYIPPINPPEIKCKVCLMNKINITFIPCRHAVTCENCAESFTKCFICETSIEGKFEIRLC